MLKRLVEGVCWRARKGLHFGGFVLGFALLQCSLSGLEVVPVEQTPEKEGIAIKIIFPRPYENKRKLPINVQLRLQGVQLGVVSPFTRAKELYNDPGGQGVHVIVDNERYFTYNQPIGTTLGSEDQILSFPIEFDVKPGPHVIRCFPVRSYGESFKGKECFKADIFYFRDRKRLDTLPFDLFKPYLTYNEPQGYYPADRSDPLLLDFYLSNCELSEHGYKLRLSVDGNVQPLLVKWVPYYIRGLGVGKHTIQLELLDEEGRLVPGPFNKVKRTIVIQAS